MAEDTIPAPTKVCTKCGEAKPETMEFYRLKKSNACRACERAYTREHRKAHLAERAAYMRAYRKKNPEIIADCEKRRLEKYREQIYAANRAAYAANREARLETNRQWREENREAHLVRRRAIAQRDKRVPKHRVSKAISGSLRQALQNKKDGAHWEAIVGYTREQLVYHLERQFKRGMTWANFGTKWHIDHIVPVSSFTFTSADDPEVRACWALTNLRPLWKLDNLSKHARRTHLI